jgi:tetratricopeptide (TPR) repeat protein
MLAGWDGSGPGAEEVDDPEGGTITEGWRALDLFVDRTELCRLFLGLLNDDPPRSRILYLHGDGGNGKSLLLDYLRTRLAKRVTPDNWAYLAALPDAECVAQAADAEDTQPAAIARLDVGQGPRDGFDAVLKLRRDLGGTGVRLPLFDFAVVTYLHKSRQLARERLHSLFPTDAIDLVQELASLLGPVPGASLVTAVLRVFDQRLGGWFQRDRQRRGLADTQVAEIDRMDHETELIRALPRYFAGDLNAALGLPGAPDRAALFVDAHEAFWGRERDLVGDLYFGRDEWLRRLLNALDPAAGVVAVVAGREPPRWAEAPTFPIPDFDLRRVGDLAEADALAYLARAGVADPALRQRLCDDARVGPDAVHPFSLGLGADLALVAARRGVPLSEEDLRLGPGAGNRRRRLVDRLLRYVDAELRDAVRAVAVCRSFDRAVYGYLGEELGFAASRAGFGVLTGFSFVRRIDRDRYRVHDLLRRLQADEGDELGREANAAMERYYRRLVEAGNEPALVDAIYHANRIDWRRGVGEWVEAFAGALRVRRFGRCGALMEIRDELAYEGRLAEALLATQEAEYWHRQARLDEARAAYTEALTALDALLDDGVPVPEVLNDRGNVLVGLGDLEEARGHAPGAEARYRAAVESLAAASGADPTNFEYLSNLGGALVRLGDTEARAGDRGAARRSFDRAFAVVAAAVRLAGGAPPLLNLGSTLLHVGRFEASMGRNRAAARSFRLAVALFDGAYRLAPRDPVAHNNRGSACHNLGRLYARQRRRKAAERWYRSAVRAADRALRLAPGYPTALANKGMYCEELAWLIAGWSRPLRVREVWDLRCEARDAFAEASAIAPGDEGLRASVERATAAIDAMRQQ